MIGSVTGRRELWRPAVPRRGAALAVTGVALAVLIAVLPLQVSAALVIGGGIAVAILARPVLGFAVLACAVPFGSVVEVPVGGISLSTIEPLVALVGLSWLAGVLSRRERAMRLPWPLWPVLLFLGLLTFEVTLAPMVALSVKELMRWVELAVVAAIGASTLRSERHVAMVLAVVLVAAMAEALLGWYQFLMRVGPPSFGWGQFLRAYGTFSQPNPFAGYLAMVWPLAMSVGGLWLWGHLRRWLARGPNEIPVAASARGAVCLPPRRRPGERGRPPEMAEPSPPARAGAGRDIPRWLGMLALLGVIIVGVAELMSFSRGAWLGLAAAAGVIAVLYRRRLFVVALTAVGLGAAIVLLGEINLLPSAVTARLSDALAFFRVFDPRTVETTPQNWAVVERMVKWHAAWGMFESAPLFGVGPGHYVVAYPSIAPREWPDSLGHAHNYYLNVLAEMGAIGLAGYLLVLAGWFAGVISRLRRLGPAAGAGSELERAVLIGVAGALTAAAVHNGFDNLYVHGMNVHVGLLLGVALAAVGHWPSVGQGSSGRIHRKEDGCHQTR